MRISLADLHFIEQISQRILEEAKITSSDIPISIDVLKRINEDSPISIFCGGLNYSAFVFNFNILNCTLEEILQKNGYEFGKWLRPERSEEFYNDFAYYFMIVVLTPKQILKEKMDELGIMEEMFYKTQEQFINNNVKIDGIEIKHEEISEVTPCLSKIFNLPEGYLHDRLEVAIWF